MSDVKFQNPIISKKWNEYYAQLIFSIYMAGLSDCMTTILYFRFADIMWEPICRKSRNGNMKR